MLTQMSEEMSLERTPASSTQLRSVFPTFASIPFLPSRLLMVMSRWGMIGHNEDGDGRFLVLKRSHPLQLVFLFGFLVSLLPRKHMMGV